MLTKWLSASFFFILMSNAPSIFSAEKIEAKTYHKPHAPVNLQFKLDIKNQADIQVNQQVSIQLTFENTTEINGLEIDIDTDKNLVLSSDNKYYFGLQAAYQKNNIILKVKPKSVGLLYINIFAHLINQGKRQSRSFAIPVNVVKNIDGKPVYFKSYKNQLKAVAGIISMPAIKR